MASPERIMGVVKILKDYYTRGEKFTVVFSAFGGVTESLISMSAMAAEGSESYLPLFEAFQLRHLNCAEQLLSEEYKKKVLPELQRNHDVLKNLLYGISLVREATPRTMDYVLSFGERNSAYIIANVLHQHGLNAAYLDARKVIKTDKNFGSARVNFDLTNAAIKEYYQANPEIQVVTGFIGTTKGGLTTTLGRGGSDYTAAIIGGALNLQSIEIWTDVDGVLTADPRKVPKAFTIPSLTYAEAMEMSHFGAKVIYPPTILPALSKKIPLWIKNTFNPEFEGTLVSDKKDYQPNQLIQGISSISQVSLLTLQGTGMVGVPGIAARLFSSLANAGINVILITQGSSEHSISFAVQPKEADKARSRVEKEFAVEREKQLVDQVKVENDLSVVAVIGENMRFQPGIAGRMFQALGRNGINCVAIAQGSSELNISVVIHKQDETKALNALHDAFFLSEASVLHLFMCGVGLIGGTLLKQIQLQAASLKEKSMLEIKVVGLANSRQMLIQPEGIDLSAWKEHLHEGEHFTMGKFVQRMKDLNLNNTIFIDNTASAEITRFYEDILDASISISTPNKIATSASFLQYQRLKTLAAKRGVLFLYETNVGAGLPVITTLNDLIHSGDEIQKIEAILSGTLSYIFNHFGTGIAFSEVVHKAMELGYTEPDPRIDLSGMDVARKLIILAREAGYQLEHSDVTIQNILPKACTDAGSVTDFLYQLEAHNSHFAGMAADAAAQGKKLRFIASLENGKASIQLKGVTPEDPFYHLSGSDNMIVFTTLRYQERPLVVRGPGAGAEVTAAGVFAEIIRIGNYL